LEYLAESAPAQICLIEFGVLAIGAVTSRKAGWLLAVLVPGVEV
jgi:hypothetical protein